MSEHCRHHMVIETPNGPTSRGICRRCGFERLYRNGHPADDFRSRGWLDEANHRASVALGPRPEVQ